MGKEENVYQLSTLGLNYIMLCKKKKYVAAQFCFRRGSMIRKKHNSFSISIKSVTHAGHKNMFVQKKL